MQRTAPARRTNYFTLAFSEKHFKITMLCDEIEQLVQQIALQNKDSIPKDKRCDFQKTNESIVQLYGLDLKGASLDQEIYATKAQVARLKKLTHRFYELQQDEEQSTARLGIGLFNDNSSDIQTYINARIQKISCIGRLKKLGVFNLHHLERLNNLPIPHVEAYFRSLSNYEFEPYALSLIAPKVTTSCKHTQTQHKFKQFIVDSIIQYHGEQRPRIDTFNLHNLFEIEEETLFDETSLSTVSINKADALKVFELYEILSKQPNFSELKDCIQPSKELIQASSSDAIQLDKLGLFIIVSLLKDASQLYFRNHPLMPQELKDLRTRLFPKETWQALNQLRLTEPTIFTPMNVAAICKVDPRYVPIVLQGLISLNISRNAGRNHKEIYNSGYEYTEIDLDSLIKILPISNIDDIKKSAKVLLWLREHQLSTPRNREKGLALGKYSDLLTSICTNNYDHEQTNLLQHVFDSTCTYVSQKLAEEKIAKSNAAQKAHELKRSTQNRIEIRQHSAFFKHTKNIRNRALDHRNLFGHQAMPSKG